MAERPESNPPREALAREYLTAIKRLRGQETAPVTPQLASHNTSPSLAKPFEPNRYADNSWLLE